MGGLRQSVIGKKEPGRGRYNSPAGLRLTNLSPDLAVHHGFNEFRDIWRAHAGCQVIAVHGEESIDSELAVGVAIVSHCYVVEDFAKFPVAQVVDPWGHETHGFAVGLVEESDDGGPGRS